MYCMRCLFQIRSWKLQKKREKVEATGGKLTVHMTIQSTQNFSWKNVSKEIIADAKVHRRRLEMKNTQIVPGAQIQSRSLKRERKIHTTPSTSAGAQEHLPPAQRILPFSVPPTSYFGHFKFRGPHNMRHHHTESLSRNHVEAGKTHRPKSWVQYPWDTHTNSDF